MSIRTRLLERLQSALRALGKEFGIDGAAAAKVALTHPKLAEHGDFSTPIALALARQVQQKPRDVAARLQALVGTADGLLTRTDIAGPGHLNFFVDDAAYKDELANLLKSPHEGLVSPGEPGSGPILLEYVSANPTGPLHVAHGRGAVHGDVLARLLVASGHQVTREYYINDMGRQTEVMAESIYVRLQQLSGLQVQEPENFYPGDYIIDIARAYRTQHGDEWLGEDRELWLPKLRAFGIGRMLERIRSDLRGFNIGFDHWVSEASVCQPRVLDDVRQRLEQNGHVYCKEDKVWFSSTSFGDDKDRVLLRDDGRPTYFLTDLAYHDQKVRRHFRRLINIWGADHGGYMMRIRAGLEALGHDPSMLEVLFVQMVSLSQKGEAVRMGKRLGTAVWLDEVVRQAGSDATRYLFSMRRIDAQMDFDVDLAMRRSIDNPVYYAQMGHARLCAIGRKAQALGVPNILPERAVLDALILPEELQLLRMMARAKDVVQDAAQALEPHQVVHYTQELIAQFHSYYTQYKHTHKVVSDDPVATSARLGMCLGLQHLLHGLLTMLGVAAPEEMTLDGDVGETLATADA